jgi:hypothetical protein
MNTTDESLAQRVRFLESREAQLALLLRAVFPSERPEAGQQTPGPGWGHFPLPLAQALWDWAHASDEV